MDHTQYQRIKRLYAEIPGSVIRDRFFGPEQDSSRPRGYRYLSADVKAPHSEIAHHLAIVGAVAVASRGALFMHVHADGVVISLGLSGEPSPEDLLADAQPAPVEVVQ